MDCSRRLSSKGYPEEVLRIYREGPREKKATERPYCGLSNLIRNMKRGFLQWPVVTGQVVTVLNRKTVDLGWTEGRNFFTAVKNQW